MGRAFSWVGFIARLQGFRFFSIFGGNSSVHYLEHAFVTNVFFFDNKLKDRICWWVLDFAVAHRVGGWLLTCCNGSVRLSPFFSLGFVVIIYGLCLACICQQVVDLLCNGEKSCSVKRLPSFVLFYYFFVCFVLKILKRVMREKEVGGIVLVIWHRIIAFPSKCCREKLNLMFFFF